MTMTHESRGNNDFYFECEPDVLRVVYMKEMYLLRDALLAFREACLCVEVERESLDPPAMGNVRMKIRVWRDQRRIDAIMDESARHQKTLLDKDGEKK